VARLGITDPGQTGPVVGVKQPPPRPTRSDAITPSRDRTCLRSPLTTSHSPVAVSEPLHFLVYLRPSFRVLVVKRKTNHRNEGMRGKRRKNFRVEWNSPATIYDMERRLARPCILSNFSNGGAKITGVRASTIPDEFALRITCGRTHKCQVLWLSDDALGVEFTGRMTKAEELNLERRTPQRHRRRGPGPSVPPCRAF
jgi:hypothetical protein